MFQNQSFIQYDTEYTKYEHKTLSFISYHIAQFQQLLRANPKLYCKLLKYNYYLLRKQQISYPHFMENALNITLYVKHVSNIWKYPDIINILSWVCFDAPFSNKSGLMYLVRKEIIDNKKIILRYINNIIFQKSMTTWKDALIMIKNLSHEEYLNGSECNEQLLDFGRIAMNSEVCCTNSSCCKAWYRHKYDFRILPIERDMMIQNVTQDTILENIMCRWNMKKERIQNKWYKCKKCKLLYCSRKCQKFDWKYHNHRRICGIFTYICRDYKIK